MLESMDLAIGTILDSLQGQRRTRRHIDRLSSMTTAGAMENPPYRGGKGDTFEGGVRVPCIVALAGKNPSQSFGRHGMIHVVDLYPTLLNQGKGSLEQKLPLDGMDMWEVITGEPGVAANRSRAQPCQASMRTPA